MGVFGALLVVVLTYLIIKDVTWFYVSYVLVPYFFMLFASSRSNLVFYDSMMSIYGKVFFDSMMYVYGKLLYFFKMLSFGGGFGVYSSTRGIVLLVVLGLPSIQAVCPICKGAVDGCAGGASCPWLTTVTANAAAVLVTATTGFISAKALLPPGLLQAFPRSVLDTILLLARMPAAGTPFNMTSTTTAAELRMAYRQGRISKSDVAEGISNLVSNAGSTSEELTKLQMQIKALELELSEAEPQSRTELLSLIHI